ncbi:MAG TPA: hypothetical protein PKC78_15915 [Accumulibacter sp.]|nr:hypothetical protein [Accumulibacter sp.]HMZ56839.1 hypothetical protein [Nitrospira sp.]
MAVWSFPSLQGVRSTRRADSEFFRPEYLLAENRIRACSFIELGRIGNFVSGPFGSAFHVQNYDFRSPYRYIRGRDVKPFFLLNDDNRYLPASHFYRLQQYEVRNNDLMISVVGTLGNVAICTEEEVPAMFSCKSTLFRSNEADPYFLLAYLNSAPGQLCLLRRQRGAIQGGLNIEDLRTIPVPRFGQESEQAIADKVRVAHRSLIISSQKYEAAQQLLESELVLDKLTYPNPVGYVAQFSELGAAHRADAEYFHVRYEAFLSAVRNYSRGCQPVNKLTKQILPNFDRRKASGEVSYIEIGDVSVSNGSYSETKVAAKDLPANAKIELSGGEIIISQVRPTRGAIAIVDDKLSHKAVCSGAFYVCTSNEVSHREIIWVYLRCMKSVFEKFCGGTSYPTIDSRYIGRFPVPLFDDGLASRIKTLVVQAKNTQLESVRLLDQAKTRVEQLIEAAIKR